jgi:D-glutamate cyclase-like, C-terminal
MPERWDPIDHLLALDPGGRGIAAIFFPGAARRAAQALVGARRVLIATGFTVAENAPETDGPPGAAVLGRALGQLGARVRYVTDPQNVPLLEAALAVVGDRADIVVYPEGDGAAPVLLRRERPTHMVAIERPGRGPGGDYLNARGVSVKAWNRPIDELFLCSDGWEPGSKRWWPVPGARGSVRASSGDAGGSADPPLRGAGARPPLRGARGSIRPASRSARGLVPTSGYERAGSRPVTIGVGDGGNEIGMGNVRARLSRLGPLMARSAAVVGADHLVVAGVSNWGAYGITAELGRLAGRALLHTPETERRLIEACVKAGAVDGITRRPEATVDSLDLDTHTAFLRLLGVAAESGMMRGTAPKTAPSISRGKASRR